MDRDKQLYNAIVILANLIGNPVAAHMKDARAMCLPQEVVLTTNEAE